MTYFTAVCPPHSTKPLSVQTLPVWRSPWLLVVLRLLPQGSKDDLWCYNLAVPLFYTTVHIVHVLLHRNVQCCPCRWCMMPSLLITIRTLSAPLFSFS